MPSARALAGMARTLRRVANVLAAAFLISVAAILAYGIWELNRGPEPIDTAPLVASAREFGANGAATSGPIQVHECTGEGSVSALIERPFESAGHNAELEADLRSQASTLGWMPGDYGQLQRGNQVLTIRSDPPDRPPGSVWLYVESRDLC